MEDMFFVTLAVAFGNLSKKKSLGSNHVILIKSAVILAVLEVIKN